jgi:diaminopimelate epimerase
MTIRFTKMHGLGNDFMVINAQNQQLDWLPKQIRALARRDTGVGFDQCLVVEKSKQEGIDFYYRIFNADGQEVGQCSNGARCLARFLQHYGLSNKKVISVSTYTTTMQLQLNDDDTVTVNLGQPKLNPADIPLMANHLATLYELPLQNGSSCKVHAINVGNPHAVMLVDDLVTAPVKTLGKQISEHPLFPEQANAGFMQLIDQNHFNLRVFERGCGETRACGSGAVAAAAIGRLYYHLAEQVSISLPGGELSVYWPDLKGPIYLTGPATFVYEGILMERIQ